MKKIIVTGANGGLGLHTSRFLLEKGYAVILACRNTGKAEQARAWLEEKTGRQSASVALLDLARLQSVRDFVAKAPKDVYGLVCNAGIECASPTQYSADGYELTFAVNHLGHYLLTRLLLEKCPGLQRIAVVASSTHDPQVKGPFEPPQFTSVEELAHPSDDDQVTDWEKKGSVRYTTSKLCNILFTYELVRRMNAQGGTDLRANAFNPGLMPGTGLIAKGRSKLTHFSWNYIMPAFAPLLSFVKTPRESGQDLSRLIDEVEVTGKYFSNRDMIPSSEVSYREDFAEELWEESARLVGLSG
jgi:NAD(P)-dependent dehydrogenase (short-subunit alcohol dehydrogenase family)